MNFPNIVLADGPMAYADVGAALEQSMVSWDDFPLDSRRLARPDRRQRRAHRRTMRGGRWTEGADAIVVSNHGGRQLDGVAPTLRVLPEVVAAARDRPRSCSTAASAAAATS